MSDEPPTPPAELSTDIIDILNSYSPDQLQHVARYAEELAEHKAREARLEEESEDEEINERPDARSRRDVPVCGSLRRSESGLGAVST